MRDGVNIKNEEDTTSAKMNRLRLRILRYKNNKLRNRIGDFDANQTYHMCAVVRETQRTTSTSKWKIEIL